MKRIFGLFLLVVSLVACAPKNNIYVTVPTAAEDAQPETFASILSDAATTASVYDQLKELYGKAKSAPAASDFDRKTPNPKRLCYKVDAADPGKTSPVTAHRYTKYIPPIADDSGIIVPERTIEKIMVGTWSDISQFDQWTEYSINTSNTGVSTNTLNPGADPKELKKVTYLFKKDGKRTYIKFEGADWNGKLDAYGVCYIPAESEKVQE